MTRREFWLALGLTTLFGVAMLGEIWREWRLVQIIQDQRIYIEMGCRGRYQGRGS
jgi:hypothetical protein